MALLEKLAGTPDATGVHCKIPPFHFYCSIREIAAGEITQQQVAAYWDNRMGGDWEASDTTDLAWLMDQYTAAGNATQREVWLAGLFAILGAVELRAPGYTTDADIKARIQRL